VDIFRSYYVCQIFLYLAGYKNQGRFVSRDLKVGITRVFRAFIIRALKGAFMGYIGLLLNAPYKIDSMMG
jgi:hypothetical protein